MKIIKKSLLFCILFIFFMNCITYAVNYKTISIDIPNSYKKLTDYCYRSSDGNVINIVFTEKNISASESDIYTESNLKDGVNSFKEETLDSVKDEVRESIEEINGKVDDETFNTIYDNISFDITSNIITNVGMGNNYKAFKFNAVIKILDVTDYEVMYAIFTKTGIYNICINSSDESYFYSNEFSNMISSIEISNPLPESSSIFSTIINWDKVTEKALISGFSTIIIGGIVAFCGFFSRLFKKKEKNDENEDGIWVKENIQEKELDKTSNKEKDIIKCRICGKEIPFNDKKICDECQKNEKEQLESKEELSESNKEISVDSTNDVDNFQLIKKYKELLEEGIITEEEFEKKKKELLKL